MESAIAIARRSLNFFYSYSHKDETLRDELETHLKLLQRQGLINQWSDRSFTVATPRIGTVKQILIELEPLPDKHIKEIMIDEAESLGIELNPGVLSVAAIASLLPDLDTSKSLKGT